MPNPLSILSADALENLEVSRAGPLQSEASAVRSESRVDSSESYSLCPQAHIKKMVKKSQIKGKRQREAQLTNSRISLASRSEASVRTGVRFHGSGSWLTRVRGVFRTPETLHGPTSQNGVVVESLQRFRRSFDPPSDSLLRPI